LAPSRPTSTGTPAERLFKFNDGGHFKHMLMRAKLAFLGLPCPKRRPVGWKPPENRLAFVGFHTFRHTWATWMRRYGGADVQGLVETGNWRDPRSASRYSHAVARDEWDRVDNLPSMGNTRGKTDAMREIHQRLQGADFPPPMAGRNFLRPLNFQEIPIFQGYLQPLTRTADDASTAERLGNTTQGRDGENPGNLFP
jgi:hypothetical protein